MRLMSAATLPAGPPGDMDGCRAETRLVSLAEPPVEPGRRAAIAEGHGP